VRQKKWKKLSRKFGPLEFKALAQVVCLFVFDSLFQLRVIRSKSQKSNADWLIGVSEVSTFLSGLGEAVENSIVLELEAHPFYSSQPAYLSNKYVKRIQAIYQLAKYANSNLGFILIGGQGFLTNKSGDRTFEYWYISKYKNRYLVCFLLGSEIRSILKTSEFAKKRCEQNVGTIFLLFKTKAEIEQMETRAKELARSIDLYADLVFNFEVDQMSYLQIKQHPIPYLIKRDIFRWDESKFLDKRKLQILHAPSRPFIKGTEHVRIAMSRLKREGFDFDYRELTGVSHDKVLLSMRSAHVFLNEFYAYSPGVASIEAMANGCVVLTRADPEIELGLGKHAEGAWVICEADEIYLKVRDILNSNREDLRIQAIKGFSWAISHCSTTSNKEHLNFLLHNLCKIQ
jgi:hypothetical protein